MQDTQSRGHCQMCGRLQAVVDGIVATHGYDVRNGYFRGRCPGRFYAPIEANREALDSWVVTLRNDAEGNREAAQMYALGKRRPDKVKTSRWIAGTPEVLEWDDALPHQRERAVALCVAQHKLNAKMLDANADALLALAERVHGQPLLEVPRPVKPAPIAVGETRVRAVGGACTVIAVWEGRVHFRNDRGSIYGMSTRAWRALPLA